MNPPQENNQNPSDIKLENMTRQELKRIEKSMKKPQFMGLLNEYMVEISDPKNRQQYDEYLKQMQRQGQLPKHLKLVQLTPHFCIRTNIVSEKNKKHNMKFFINYCSTQFLQQPVCQPSQNQQGKTAFGWRVPNSMGKIRYDQDKNGNPCQVADVAFNHKCFQIIEAQSNLPFRKNQFKSMLVSIGLECAQKQLGERKQTLSKDYDILKNLKCKGEKPALLPLRYIKGKAYNKGQSPGETIQRDSQGRQTKLQKQINQQKEAAQKAKKEKQIQQKQDEMQQELQNKKTLIQDLEEGIQQPKYSSIYTYPVDYSEYMQDPSYNKASKTPSHFTVQFKLPRVQGMQQIGGDSLNINENRIILKIGQKYFIDLSFETFKTKYKLLTNKIKAKFDKKKKVLKVTFPIDQSIKYHEDEKNLKKQLERQQTNEQNNEQQNKLQVIQNQTWKNKVLQVEEPSVNLKVIDNKQQQNQVVEQPKKKLVEEIDQDDYPQQSTNAQNKWNNRSQPQNFHEALDQQKNHAFSLRKYYDKTKKNSINNVAKQKVHQQKIQQKPNQLDYVFQQTNDKIVLIIKMQNYKKQEVRVIYDELENNRYFVEWNQNTKENNSINQQQEKQGNLGKLHILHFIIVQPFNLEIKKVEVVYRVNFVAIFIHKASTNKFWQKESIKKVELRKEQEQKTEYELFNTQLNEVLRGNREREELNEKKRKEEDQMKEKQEKTIETLKNDEQTKQKSQVDQKSSKKEKVLNEEKLSKTTEKLDKKMQIDNMEETEGKDGQKQQEKLQGEYFNLNSLPPQFIHFDVKFIEEID